MQNFATDDFLVYIGYKTTPDIAKISLWSVDHVTYGKKKQIKKLEKIKEDKNEMKKK